MRARVTITHLSPGQWRRLQVRLKTDYIIPAGTPTVCAVFELSEQNIQGEERHAEMPVFEFSMLVAELAQVGASELVAEATLTPDALPDHLEDQRNAADPARRHSSGHLEDQVNITVDGVHLDVPGRWYPR